MLVPRRARNYAIGAGVVGALANPALVQQAGRYLFRSAYGAARQYNRTPSASQPMKRKRTTSKRRRTVRSSRAGTKYRKLKPTSTKCKVKKLCKFMNQTQADHEHRNRYTEVITTPENTSKVVGYTSQGTITALQSAMANLRFYDTTTDALVLRDPANGTYQRDITVAIFRKILITNNYQVPVYVHLYSCTPKVDQADNAANLFATGLVDQQNPLNTSVLINFKDSIDMKSLWNCKLIKKGLLKPGSTYVGSRFHKQFDYNFGVTDEHTLPYQKRYGGHNWVVRITGVLGHDIGGGTGVGSMSCGVDIAINTTYKFKYDAGKDLHDITVSDNADAPVSGFVKSAVPVVDNQAYSKT